MARRFEGGNGPPEPLKVTCTGKQGPVPPGSAMMPCPACLKPILPGQFFTLFPIGPGGDPKLRSLARARVFFDPVFVAVHWACVTGDESESNLAL
jgi:hypothetical protein